VTNPEPVERATAEPITAVIADRVRWFRERSGMSQAELAEHMNKLGTPWKRATVVNLEKRGTASRKRGTAVGRDSVTVQELLALAEVLNVPITALLVDERAERTRLGEGREYATADLLLWLTAVRPLPGAPDYDRALLPRDIVLDHGPWAVAARPARYAQQQQKAIDAALGAREELLMTTEKGYEPAINKSERYYAARLRDLAAVLGSMRAAEMTPVPVDDRLAHDAEHRGIPLSAEVSIRTRS
jgi:transcriptional regulator with XRE-family HTH domain